MCPVYHPGRSPERASERLRFVTYRLNCFLWVENPEFGPIPGFGFAGDISETGVGAYIGQHIRPLTRVRVAFGEESASPYRGQVAWCQRLKLNQRFLGHASSEYRLGVRLQFSTEAERQRYLLFLRELSKSVMELAPKKRKR